MTKLYLIRHGQTDQGLNRKYCGARDVPLNETGCRQAAMLVERFKGCAIDAVVSSDLKRAVQTAQIVFKDAAIIKRSRFREMDFGVIEGLGYDEARQEYADIYEAWIHSPMTVTLPGGEAFVNFCARVLKGYHELLAEYENKHIVLVAHGGPIRAILCDVLKRGMNDFWSISQDNAALNVIEYHSGEDPKVVVMNDTGHLG
ncbi:MAG: histidine phosphatase family protein [Candidatus Omnitrophica bacterium]|nr:histidine phosphatase family protein [Candidatus Omnitrophota bacterium]